MANPLLATIRGLPETPTLTEINIRSAPSTKADLVLKAAVGMNNLVVLEAHADTEGNNYQGKVYQWLKLAFPDGKSGWARDDLLELVGDGTAFGYTVIGARTFAFTLKRDESKSGPPPAEPAKPVAAPQAKQPAEAAPAKTAAPAPEPQKAPPPKDQSAEADPCVATTVVKANMRSGPSTNEQLVASIDANVTLTVLEARPEGGGSPLYWLRVTWQDKQGWMRDDNLRVSGNVESVGLKKSDLYSPPMKKWVWVRGFTGPLPNHEGWDLGAAVGEPVYCGPTGGIVVASVECTKCTPDKPNTLSQGLKLYDESVYSDPAWGYGYGNYVIVGYMNEQLPQTTRDFLAANNFAGGHIFVMHAHLSARNATVGQKVEGNALIGACGNTGNSEGPHAHLEIRASASRDFSRWANLKKGLFDPGILFGR